MIKDKNSRNSIFFGAIGICIGGSIAGPIGAVCGLLCGVAFGLTMDENDKEKQQTK